MPNTMARLALGITTGAVGLIAMIRLVSGAFSEGPTRFAWMAILLAMIPWVAYCAWRAWRGNMSTRGAIAVLGLCLAGVAIVWLWTLGPVIALACSLAAFGVIWVSDLPPLRSGSADTFVKIEELNADDPD
ncbi:MAG TPA: hypothetical protein VNT27_15560 [Propionibacteriaceae bacterium]|jgi:hypothetical protein|nr:hypothetical protein [Propionibacteriaceae bacterium]